MADVKRIFVGGLADNVTKNDLLGRFERFGEVISIDIRVKKDAVSDNKKTFAYVSMKITEDNLNKCINIYNKSKWKGKELCLQLAKENFLERLQREREANADSDSRTDKKSLPSSDHKLKETVTKTTPEDKPVENMKNWVVDKQGTSLPVVYIRQKDKKKVVKIDPTKYMHQKRILDDEAKGLIMDPVEKSVESLTWQIDEEPKKHTATINGEMSGKLSKRRKLSKDQAFESSEKHQVKVPRHVHMNHNAGPLGHQQVNKTVDFDSDIEDQIEVGGKGTSAYCGSSEDTDELLSKLKTSARKVKSQTKIKLERTRAEKSSMKEVVSGSKFGNENSEDSSLEECFGIDDVGQVTSLPKWLESESDSDNKKSETFVNKKPKRLLEGDTSKRQSNEKSCIKAPSEGTVMSSMKWVKSHAKDKPLLHSAPNISISRLTEVNKDIEKAKKSKTVNSLDKVNYIQKVLDEYSSGLQEEGKQNSSSDGEELDVFEMIESGKVKKLYKMDSVINPCTRDEGKAKQTLSSDLVKEDVQKEMRKPKKDALGAENKTTVCSDFMKDDQKERRKPKESVVGIESHIKYEGKEKQKKSDVKKTACVAEKQLMANQKRLDSLKKRMLEAQQQKALVQQALASLELQQKPSNKIVFNSDDEMNEMPVLPAGDGSRKQTNVVQSSTSESEAEEHMAHKMKSKTQVLFESDSSDSSGDDAASDSGSDEERFKIRPEFEGKAGLKLLQLQSRFGDDKRFRLDSRFIESSSESDSNSDTEMVTQTTGVTMSEKQRAIEILKSVVGGKALNTKKQEKVFKDINMLHYDPTSENHAQFEITAQPKQSKKKKKLKEDVGEEKVLKNELQESKEEEPKLPEVSRERFFEVETSLKDLFQKKNEEEPFSLASAFEQNLDKNDEQSSADDSENQSLVNSSLFPWQQLPACKDSYDEEEDDDTALGKDINTESENVVSRRSVFFMQLDDPDVQESLQFFTNSMDKEEMRAKWLEERPGLIEAYKLRRKRKLRNLHTKEKFNRSKGSKPR